jgi:hypothetical protein
VVLLNDDLTSQLIELQKTPELEDLTPYSTDIFVGKNSLVELVYKILNKLEDFSQIFCQIAGIHQANIENISPIKTNESLVVKSEHTYSQFKKYLNENNLDNLYKYIDEIPAEQVLQLIQNPDALVSRFSTVKTEFELEVLVATRKMGCLQKKVLLKIYEEGSKGENLPVRWLPSKWFGNGAITSSDRANWSKALTKLKARELIEEQSKDNSGLSKVNRGNGFSYVRSTPLGLKTAKWLTK